MKNFNILELHEMLKKAISQDTDNASDLAADIESKYVLKTDMDIRFIMNFVNTSDNEDPTFASEGASGFDLRANLEEDLSIQPLSRAMVPTGLSFNIPAGFEIQIRPRSGLAAKNGVTVLNSPGTIDSDYTGEVMIILFNSSQEVFNVRNGDRIAQAVVSSTLGKNIINLKRVTDLDKETERGAGGFGSTGLQ